MFKYLLLFIIFFSALGTMVALAPKPVKVQAKPTPTHTSIALHAEKLTTLVNDWRDSQGYQPYVEHEALCEIAEDRFKDGIDQHRGFYERYSSYPSSLSENVASGNTEKQALQNWLNSTPHREALERPYRYSCIKCTVNLCFQIFSNLENGTL